MHKLGETLHSILDNLGKHWTYVHSLLWFFISI